MKDHVFIGELRKRVSVLEDRYEALERDLKAARITLAMFERESVNNSQAAGHFSQAEIIADIVIDALSHQREMHRANILEAVVSKGVHVGYEDDEKKQLSAVSTLLSKDARFKPVKGRSGYWSLARTEPGWPDPSDDSGNTVWGSEDMESEPCDANDITQENTVLTRNRPERARGDVAIRHRDGAIMEGV